MKLHNLEYTKGSRNHKEKRVGRGHGTGFGKTSGRGQDGQKSRKSGQVRLAFEGGQTPLYRRVPKVGFNNDRFATKFNIVTLDRILEISNKLNVTNFTLNFLYENKVAKYANLPIKVISSKKELKLPKQLVIEAHKFTQGALETIANSQAKAQILA